MNAIPLRRDVHYPESDGKPMGETEIHIREIMYLFQALDELLRNTPDVYVGADMLLYYVEGNPKQVVVPDVFVTLGVPRGQRRIYKVWEEGEPPSLIVEVTSDSTRSEDLSRKKDLYQRLGVREYILYDPLQDYLEPALQGFRMVNGRYQPMPLGPGGSIASETTGATFRIEERGVRVIDSATGKPILSNEEVRSELARLEAEIERLRRLTRLTP
jgi:Uma2 family endonuclease